MTTFESFCDRRLLGKLTTVDRFIVQGHLTTLMMKDGMKRWMSSQGVLLKDFGKWAKAIGDELVAHAKTFAADAGRPYEYHARAMTAARGLGKEDYARTIAERDGITDGLVCVLSFVEPCRGFDIRGNRKTHRLEVVQRDRKCLHIYFYFIDRDFGLMHVRLQTWLPMQIQVYINGREYLARQLARKGIDFERYENALTRIDDLRAAERLAEKFIHLDWPRVLDRLARRVNPVLNRWLKQGMLGYFWSIRQCEVATDLMFRDRNDLAELMPALRDAAIRTFSADDVMRFLGRKPNGNFKGEVCTDLKTRPEGCRVKHSIGRNSIKFYDKLSVLRIETTFNAPRDFKILRTVQIAGELRRQWRPIGKGIGNLYRYIEVATAANERYLAALADVQLKGRVVEELDALSRSRIIAGRRVARLQPFERHDNELFEAILRGEHLIHGFRNRDLRKALFGRSTSIPAIDRKRRARISRAIAKLRDHGLVAKVRGSHLYRITQRGHRLMAAAVRVRNHEFHDAILAVAA